ncbi:hypothetical protein MM213_06350 [Belliella sp. R4-6]|uniref:Outer membrane protein beta-barrel domain-containing protein n=1 Tax=Belliella alkalica TaxID=1730871 RepID=A0ABS9VAY8_9BACT|nr:hypothetical protein [Belliella alkalica]MCH7413095.1 hypothetical protein [Belliella alkalica]
MKKIKFLFVLLICFFWIESIAQNNTEFKSQRKYSKSYDEENLKLLESNDTLNVFINGEKKVTFLWDNISYLNRFEGFEKEIDTLFILFDQLDLDFVNNAYDITFSPQTKELLIKKHDSQKLKAENDQIIPLVRHTLTFVYRKIHKGEVKLYLGEIDELKVWKEAGLTERIKNLYELNDWKNKYFTNVFSKDLIIKENGEQEVITYKNIERSKTLSFHLNMGVNVVANNFPAVTEFSLMYNLGRSNKRLGLDLGFGLYHKNFSFVSKNDDNSFSITNDGFLGAGINVSPQQNIYSIRYGRLIGSNNSFFNTYRNNLGFEVGIRGPFKVNLDYISEKMFSGRTMIAFGITTRFF